MTSTYDHRVIQGAESGAFLSAIDELLQGADGFYDGVFGALGVDIGRAAAPATEAPLHGRRARPGRGHPEAVAGVPDEGLLQAVQAATSVVKAHRMHGHLAAHARPARLASRAATRRSTRRPSA